MKRASFGRKKLVSLLIWAAVGGVGFIIGAIFPNWLPNQSGMHLTRLVGFVGIAMAASELLSYLSYAFLKHRKKPAVEAEMVGHLYRLVGGVAVLMLAAFAFGQLSAFGEFFTLFGGMLLGWSLQAPVSGFAAWALISAKRPFRPGDRVQFPSLGLTGDVHDIGLMYTVLNQVGGSIGSEEAVGRYILVPNAMLFSQVAINYTVLQDAPYMLDEVVVRITYDSDWEQAEGILLSAATEVTRDVIEATGEQPYIRSDLYDYGVYLRLRFKTAVQKRAETAYNITKLIFAGIQRTPSIDLAIPYIYSYRSGADRKEQSAARGNEDSVKQIAVDRIQDSLPAADPQDIQQLAQSIAASGLLQPIVVAVQPDGVTYEVLAGGLRLAACRKLDWKSIPAIVQNRKGDPPHSK